MTIHFGTELIQAQWSDSTVCIGVFDGVHLGHQRVISFAVQGAREREQPSILLTFDRHPASIIAPDRVPLSIATLSQNLDQFKSLGISIAVVIPFDQVTANTTAQEFLDTVLQGKLKAEHLVVGHDFAFGKNRQGTGEWLSGQIATTIIEPLVQDGHRISSSEIRQFIREGSVEKAHAFLGRPYEFQGTVVRGQKLGRTLGYPTLNLVPSSAVCIPKNGVYGGWCRTPIGVFLAATSVGVRPTVDGTHQTIESYLIDYPGENLYGANVELGFSWRLRDEVKFESVELMVEQIQKDVAQVRNLASGN